MDLTKKLLKVVSLPLTDSFNTAFRSYRVAPRAQNAHAYVNAAFLLRMASDKMTVKSATLCFGGINPKVRCVTVNLPLTSALTYTASYSTVYTRQSHGKIACW